MSVSNPDLLLKEIADKKFHPVYLLTGEEPYYIDILTEALEKSVVREENRSFCQFVMYGADQDIGRVVQTARSYPFMADRQLVMVKEAHKLGGLDTKEGVNLLENYVLNPAESTVLVLAYPGKIDARSALAKAIDSKGVFFSAKKMYDNKLPEWLGGYCLQKGVKISPRAVQMIVEHIGNDLKRIHNEVQKVLVNLAPGQSIDVGEVEKFIGISKEYNIFELQKAFSKKDVRKATQIAAHMALQKKGIPVLVIVQALFGYFTKVLLVHYSRDKSKQGLAAALGVNPYFVGDFTDAARHYSVPKLIEIIHLLRLADGKTKGVGTGSLTDSAILEELVFRILH